MQPIDSQKEERDRLKASLLSLLVSLLLLGIKFYGFYLTGSQAIFSDALETVVNIASATLALFVILISSKPADQNHPYGHGKAEFFSAAFEGGLLVFAALMISYEAIQAMILGHTLAQLNQGLLIVLGAGIMNAALGFYLKAVGKRTRSMTLTASGAHVLSDFWTSLGVVVGLVLVKWTGWVWLDSLIALIVGLHLIWTGIGLVRHSTGGLMDEEDREVIETLGQLFSKHVFPGIIRIHYTRVIRAGRDHHIDAHVVVPEFWSVTQAHERSNEFEKKVMEDYPYEGRIHFHVDPCRRAYCRACDYHPCPIRREPFQARRPFNLEELTSPQEPEQFR